MEQRKGYERAWMAHLGVRGDRVCITREATMTTQITRTDDIARGRMYWGSGPLPHGARLAGTVTRQTGETGALIIMPSGVLVQGNAGAIRSLPQDFGRVPRAEKKFKYLANMLKE